MDPSAIALGAIEQDAKVVGCGCAGVFFVGLLIGLAVGCGLVAEVWSYLNW